MSQTLSGQQSTTQTEVVLLKKKRERSISALLIKIVLWILVGFLVVVVIYPLIWMLLASFKTTEEFSSTVFWSLPIHWQWQNYVDAWNSGMSTYFLNSIFVVFPSLFLNLLIGLAAAFGLEVMRWRGGNTVLLIFLAGIMVPAQLVLLPLFTMYFEAGLINTRWALILTYTAFGLPLTVFLMAGFFKSVPRSLIEASILDGANIYQVFYRVAVPIVGNGLFTIALFTFFFMWNDLLFSLTFISDDSLRTIQTGLLNFTGQYGQVEWGPTFAAAAIAVLPTLLIYLVLNQQVIKGLTAGAVKG